MQDKNSQWIIIVGVLATLLFLNHGILAEYIPSFCVPLISAVIIMGGAIYFKKIYEAKIIEEQALHNENKTELLNAITSGIDNLTTSLININDKMENNFKEIKNNIDCKFSDQENLIVAQFTATKDVIGQKTNLLHNEINEKYEAINKAQQNSQNLIINKIIENNDNLEAKINVLHKTTSEQMRSHKEAILSSVQTLRTETEKHSDAINLLIANNSNAIISQLNANKEILEKDLLGLKNTLTQHEVENKEITMLAKKEILEKDIAIMNELVARLTEMREVNEQLLFELKTETINTGSATVYKLDETSNKTTELVLTETSLLNHVLSALKDEVAEYAKETITLNEQNKNAIVQTLNTNTAVIKDNFEKTTSLLTEENATVVSALGDAKQEIITNTATAKEAIVGMLQDQAKQLQDTSEKVSGNIVAVKDTVVQSQKDLMEASGHNKADIIQLFNNNAVAIKEELVKTKEQITEENAVTITALGQTKQDVITHNMAIKEAVTNILNNQTKELQENSAELKKGIIKAKDEILADNLKVLSNSMIKADEMLAETKMQIDVMKTDAVSKLDVLTQTLSETTEKKIETVNNVLIAMKKDITKQFDKVMDSIDDSVESRNAKYNKLFKQTQDFSFAVDKVLKALKTDILNEQQKIAIEQELRIENLQESIAKEQYVANNLYGQFEIQQNTVIYTLDELQRKVSAMDEIREVLKKISVDKGVQGNIAQKTNNDFYLDPNRVEEIVDQGSSMTVVHVYKDGKIVSSKMKQKDKVVYERNYTDKGILKNTKSYDKKGVLLIEASYWPNGQVKERIEYVDKNGSKQKSITKYNEKGQIIK